MRQVPTTSTNTKTPLTDRFGFVLTFLFSNEFAFALVLPTLSVVFFGPSPLFHTLHPAFMGLFYGLCFAFTRWGSVIASMFILTWSDYTHRHIAWLTSSVALLFLGLCCGIGLVTNEIVIFLAGFLFFGLLDVNKPLGAVLAAENTSNTSRLTELANIQTTLTSAAFLAPILSGYLIHHVSIRTPFLLVLPLAFFSLAMAVLARRRKSAEQAAGDRHPDFTLPGSQQCFAPRDDNAVEPESQHAPTSENSTQPYSHPCTVIASAVKQSSQIKKDFRQLFANTHIRQLLLLLMLNQVCWSLFYEFVPALLRAKHHASAVNLGYYIGLIALYLLITAAFLIKQLHKQLNTHQIFRLGVICMLAGQCLLLLSTFMHSHTTTTLVWIAACPTAVGDIFCFVVLMQHITQTAGNTHLGKVTGAAYTLMNILHGFTALIGGALIVAHLHAFLYITLLCALLLLHLSNTRRTASLFHPHTGAHT